MSEYTTRQILDLIEANGGPEGLDLSGADLSGITLTGQDLHGIKLARWDNEHNKWIAANLTDSTLWAVNLSNAKLCGVSFVRANLRDADLPGADLASADFRGATLFHADLSEANIGGVDLSGSDLRKARLSQVDLRDAKSLEGIQLHQARFDRTRLNRDQLGIVIGDEPPKGSYAQARGAYLALKHNFEDLGDYEAANWAYRKERRMEKREAWEKARGALRERDWGPFVSWTWKVARDLAVEYLCDYGEGVGLVLGWMGFLLFIAGPLLFGLPGLLDWPKENYEAFFSRPVPRCYGYAYLQQFLYVLDAFTTASFAELEPATALTRILSGLTALIGVFLTGLLGFVAGNRIRRS
jgi:hypothetical protein